MDQIIQNQRGPFGETPYWDIFRQGKWIIGSQSETEAAIRYEQLEQNEWSHLDCFRRGHPDPLKFIAFVREKDWTFDLRMCQIQFVEDGRFFFSGNIEQYSMAFRYLVLDPELIQEIQKAAPEIPVHRGVSRLEKNLLKH